MCKENYASMYISSVDAVLPEAHKGSDYIQGEVHIFQGGVVYLLLMPLLCMYLTIIKLLKIM